MRGILPPAMLCGFSEESDQIAFLVNEPITRPLPRCGCRAASPGLQAPRLDSPDEGVDVVAFVADESLHTCRRQPERRVGLSDEVVRVAQGVGDGVDRGARPALDFGLGVAAAAPAAQISPVRPLRKRKLWQLNLGK